MQLYKLFSTHSSKIKLLSNFSWKNYRLFILIGASTAFLQSCTMYNPYKRPCVEISESWRTEFNDQSTVANTRWWELLGDPILDELIVEALESNKNIKLAIARVFEYQGRLGIVNSQFFPQISGQVTSSRQRFSQTVRNGLTGFGDVGSGSAAGNNPLFPSGFTNFSPFINDYRGVINASYEFDFWGKIRSASIASYAELLAQVQARRTVVLTVVTSVANAYIILRQYDQQLQIALQTLKSRQESYDLALIRFEEGLTSELEVKQAASEVDEAQIAVIQYNNLIPQQENLISVLLGHPPQAVLRGKMIEEMQTPEIPAGIPADILEQRPDIMQAEDQLIAAEARVSEARALFFPNITLTGYYGTESSQLHQLFTNPSKIWEVVGNLFQPIFEGGRLLSNLDVTKAVKYEAYYNYQQTILTALQEVDNSLIAHVQSKKGLEASNQRVKDLQSYLDLATLQYENGLVDYLNVLDAQRRLFAAQLDLAQANALIFTTLINIYQSLGGGWVVDADNQVICPNSQE